jgi:hypothetical protein
MNLMLISGRGKRSCRFGDPGASEGGDLSRIGRGGDVEKNIRDIDQWIDGIVRKLGFPEEPLIPRGLSLSGWY